MTSAEPVRVLLIGSDGDVLEAMRRALSAPEFAIVGEAWPGLAAVRSAAQEAADVILIHVEPPLGPAARTIQATAAAAPGAGIAVVSRANDLETIRRSMNAGADDFATLPLTDAGVQEVARRAHGAAQRRLSGADTLARVAGRVITVAGPRGGVGKTTLAANLAIALAAEPNVSVAIVDLDLLFGATAIALGMMPATTLQDWLRAQAGGQALPAARFLASHRGGARLLAAPFAPDAHLDFGGREAAMVIEDLASTHDFVVVDTPASFTPVTTAAVELASAVLLMTTADLASLRAVRYVLQTLRAWDFAEERIQLVRNRPLRVDPENDAAVGETVGIPIAWSLPHDRTVARTADLGSPVCESHARSPMAREVTRIAHYLVHGEASRRRRWLRAA